MIAKFSSIEYYLTTKEIAKIIRTIVVELLARDQSYI